MINSVNYEEHSNEEVEACFIGNLFVKPETLFNYDLEPEDFFQPLNGAIFAEMKRQLLGNKIFNKMTVIEFFKKEEIESAVEYIPLLPVTSTDSQTMSGYIEIIKNHSRKRRIIQGAEQVLNSSHLPLRDLSGVLIKSLEQCTTDSIKTSQQVAMEILEDLTLPKNCYAISGLDGLNDCMSGGLYEGFTYGFCGPEKSGKTTLAHSISYGLKCNHLYIAMEMGSKQIEQRNIAREAGKNSLAFLKNPVSMKDNVTQLKANSRFYLDAPGMTLEDMLYNITKSIVKHQIKGVIVDYWQLIGGQERGQSEEKHLRNCAQELANYARKNKIWCVLLAQMNQDGKLFGGNGLRKACDQLYMIEESEFKLSRWLKMDASRYTFRKDLGNREAPKLLMEEKIGPYFYTDDQLV